MAQLSDLEIANLSKLKPISEIARKVGITEDALEPYGHYKAKIDINAAFARCQKTIGRLLRCSP